MIKYIAMLSRIMTPLMNTNGLGWVMLTVSLLIMAAVMFWALSIVNMPMLYFVFIVLFPLIFIVVVPLIAFFLFVDSQDKS